MSLSWSRIGYKRLVAVTAVAALGLVLATKTYVAAQSESAPRTEASSTDAWSASGAVDGDRFAVQSDHAWRGKPGEKHWSWQIRFPQPQRIGAILQVVGDDPLLFQNAPCSYVWQGSVDGEKWTELKGTAIDKERRLFRIHRITEPQQWQFLRMLISEAVGEAPTLREVEFYPDTQAAIDFPDWVLPVSTEENPGLPFAGPDFVDLARSCHGWEQLQAQHIWLDNFDEDFIAIEPRPLCAFLSGNLAEWCQRTREPWRGTQEILKNGHLPIWASCGGAQGLAILTEVGYEKPWDCPRCRDARDPKSPIYTHIGHLGPSKCGEYDNCVFERGPTFVRQVAEDPAFAGLPVEFETVESHCGQIDHSPVGWTLVVTNGKNGKTKTQCIRLNDRPVYAAQFHIEMQGTPDSSLKIMSNFLGIAKQWGGFNFHGVALAPPRPL